MTTRTDKDTMGEIEVPADKYWGAQTQRSLENFKIGTEVFPKEFIHAFAIVKKASASVNKDLEKLPSDKAEFIIRACDEILSSQWSDQFPLKVWQTGSGTQTNMNLNEVIANRANELAGYKLGEAGPIHPNDDVNKSQSSNDTFPTAMHIASFLSTKENLVPAVKNLIKTFSEKEKEFSDIVKIGRTHLMDATPLTLAQEFSGYRDQLEKSLNHIEHSLEEIRELALGGSAVGTGLNTHPEYAERVAQTISQLTGEKFITAPNKFSALACHDSLVTLSSSFKRLAAALIKICNDIRFLASGPRSGIGELILPANEPGSSIMPGKVNPTQCEALTMVCVQVMGYDSAISLAGSQGHFELNVYKPLIIHNILQQINLLTSGIDSFTNNCAQGVQANKKVIHTHVENSLMLVTALNQHIGYENAAKIAKHAYLNNTTLKEAAIELDLVTAEEFTKWVKPKDMTHP
ncbi:MAG: fumarate hydratase, class II [Halobacteriovoraceae bacterium]|nr:fumarate hydratase, class II [Halobacteriovoraceae bacterium]|tara:strand:+ start:9841 stop:11226 length:1386 start_codon:yes stop_codon:yes gene_type:complete